MAQYTVQTMKSDLESVLHGTTINQITNIDNLIDRAARQLLLDLDPQETKRILPISNAVYSQIYNYPVPTDLKGNKIIDIMPQVNRTANDVWSQNYNQQFDATKQTSLQDSFTIQFNTSIKTVRINAPYLPPPIILNTCDQISDNGTWTTGGGASNLTVSNLQFVSGSSSLKFDLDAGQSSGYLENSTMQANDLETVVNQAYEFLYTYLPDADAITSVELRFGSSASDYYARTVTTTQENTALENGWNLLAYEWNGSTVVGTPDPSSITYVRVTYNYDSTLQTGVYLDNITSNLGSILNMSYYSKYLFRDILTGTFQETVTDDSNLINLDTESYNLLFNQVAFLAVQQQQGVDANFYDGNFFQTAYLDGVKRYKAMYKSEIQKPQSTYYVQPNPGYNTSIPWWFS